MAQCSMGTGKTISLMVQDLKKSLQPEDVIEVFIGNRDIAGFFMNINQSRIISCINHLIWKSLKSLSGKKNFKQTNNYYKNGE